VFFFAIYGLVLFLLLQWRTLASIAAMFVYALLQFPTTWDSSSWYINGSLSVLYIVVALAGYGFFTAVEASGVSTS
jgi:hypothetical protein